jgi:hypothetical protein
MAHDACHRHTRDGYCVASPRLTRVLELEESSANWANVGPSGGQSADPTHVGRESSLGRPADPRRIECLDHVIVLSATGLQRLMHVYCAYYEHSRTHLSLNKDAPIPRPIAPPSDGRVVAIPQVGGLHHRYERQAA